MSNIKRAKIMKLNIGCGMHIKKGYINLDKIKAKGVDLVWDLDKFPYPFKDNSVSKIYCEGILEHLKDFEKSFKELTRILKPKGILHILVPHFSSGNNYSEFHKTNFKYKAFSPEEELILTKSVSLELIELYKPYKTVYRKLTFLKRFPLVWNYIIEFIINLHPYFVIFWEQTGLCNFFPAKAVDVKLIKSK